MPIPALLAPLVPLAVKGLAIGGLGTGVSVGINQIPYLKKQNIKNAATKNEYNPATREFKAGYEWDPGDTTKAIFGGYSKQDVLDAEHADFQKRARQNFAGQRKEIQNLYSQMGFTNLPELMVREGEDIDSYGKRLINKLRDASAMESLQGLLTGGNTLESIGMTPRSSFGDINSATRKYDPMGEYQEMKRTERALSAQRGQAQRNLEADRALKKDMHKDMMGIEKDRTLLQQADGLRSQIRDLQQHQVQMGQLGLQGDDLEFRRDNAEAERSYRDRRDAKSEAAAKQRLIMNAIQGVSDSLSQMDF